jgi:TorA maturation chaperone TorD
MTKPSPIDWQGTLTGEMLLLSLISRAVYNYPEERERIWLKSLFDEGVFFETPFAADKDETKTGLEFLQKWGVNGISAKAFENVQADYTRLFIGPGEVLAPPWESVHFGDDRLIFQQRTLDVRAWYQRFGLEAEKIRQEPDDHIGLELSFLSHLAALGIQALDEQDNARFEDLLNAQREFFDKHLGAWALEWCGLVEKHSQTEFYTGMAYLIRGALSALSEALDTKLVKDTAR